MTRRGLFLDEGFGETRGVVTLDGRPERLLLARLDDPATHALGARLTARVRRIDRASAIAFLDLGAAPDAILNLGPAAGRIVEGQALEVEIRAEGRIGKGPLARWLGP
ncbi:MAG: ribonuclease E/G, partial [Caulobacteraceae bacterium]|nr:ribonuclease E/G [Caulobacteraceae bacterium]